MKDLKNQKGAITMIVLVTTLFLLAFLMSAYMIVSNRAKKQGEMSKEIEQLYTQSENLINIYNSYFNNEIIPIYNETDFSMIGTGEDYIINGKYCKMAWSETYALMEDLELTENTDIPIKDSRFTGSFEWNGHTITVTNSLGEETVYFSESF